MLSHQGHAFYIGIVIYFIYNNCFQEREEEIKKLQQQQEHTPPTSIFTYESVLASQENKHK